MYVNLLKVWLLLVFPVAIEAKDFKLFSDLAFVSLLLGFPKFSYPERV